MDQRGQAAERGEGQNIIFGTPTKPDLFFGIYVLGEVHETFTIMGFRFGYIFIL